MTTDNPLSRHSLNKGTLFLFTLATALTYLLIVSGGVVCITDSSRGCPDWPGCYGKLVPPPRLDSILEYVHRVGAAMTAALVIASAAVGWHRTRSIRWISWSLLLAIGFLLAVVVFGALVVLRGLPVGLAVLDLGSALMVLALMVTATTTAYRAQDVPWPKGEPDFRNSLARLLLWTLLLAFVVLVSGVLVAEPGSFTRCLGWPLFGEVMDAGSVRGWLILIRRTLAVVASILLVVIALRVWQMDPMQRSVRHAVRLALLLHLAEIVVGIYLVEGGIQIWLLVLYAALAAAFWSVLVGTVILVGWNRRDPGAISIAATAEKIIE